MQCIKPHSLTCFYRIAYVGGWSCHAVLMNDLLSIPSHGNFDSIEEFVNIGYDFVLSIFFLKIS